MFDQSKFEEKKNQSKKINKNAVILLAIKIKK